MSFESLPLFFFFFFQAEDGIRDSSVTGVQTCALPILKQLAKRKPNYKMEDLCRARPLYHRRDGHCQNLQIYPQGPLIQILDAERHPLLEPDSTTSLHLPSTGDSRSHAESPALPVFAE